MLDHDGDNSLGDDGKGAPEGEARNTSRIVQQTSSEKSFLTLARQMTREIRLRTEAADGVDEARWMILLDIYLAMSEARDTPFMSAAHASSAPVSTAQRYIHDMIEAGLIAQDRSGADQRVTYVSLSSDGIALVENILERVHNLRSR